MARRAVANNHMVGMGNQYSNRGMYGGYNGGMAQTIAAVGVGGAITAAIMEVATGGVKMRYMPLLLIMGVGALTAKGVSVVGKGVAKGVHKGVQTIQPTKRMGLINQYINRKASNSAVYSNSGVDSGQLESLDEAISSVEPTFAESLQQYLLGKSNVSRQVEMVNGGKVCGIQLSNARVLLCDEDGIKDTTGKNYLKAGYNIVDTTTPLINKFNVGDERTLMAVIEWYFSKGMLEV